jgi:hypothetical protein
MGDWQPEKTEDVDGRKVYYWTIPKTPTRAERQLEALSRVIAGNYD